MPVGGRKNHDQKQEDQRQREEGLEDENGRRHTKPLLDEQMDTFSNSCPTQDSEPRKRCEDKNPRARVCSNLEIADILVGWWWERELVLWIQMSGLVMQSPEVLHCDRGLAVATTNTNTPRKGAATSSTGLL